MDGSAGPCGARTAAARRKPGAARGGTGDDRCRCGPGSAHAAAIVTRSAKRTERSGNFSRTGTHRRRLRRRTWPPRAKKERARRWIRARSTPDAGSTAGAALAGRLLHRRGRLGRAAGRSRACRSLSPGHRSHERSADLGREDIVQPAGGRVGRPSNCTALPSSRTACCG